jgi:glutathione reductase (NADPH)
VELDQDGSIRVDAFSRSTDPSIFAVGDVTGRAALTPVAIREGWYFAETVFNGNPMEVDYALIPSAVFAEPEIGTIGLTEAEAAEKHSDLDVYVARFRPMQNTLSDRPERMLLKLITEGGAGRVVGCHILGPGAAEMIQLVAIPMTMGATKADFDRTIAVHPTASEELVTFKSPSYSWRGGKKMQG